MFKCFKMILINKFHLVWTTTIFLHYSISTQLYSAGFTQRKMPFQTNIQAQNIKTNGRQPKSCFGRVFNFKQGCSIGLQCFPTSRVHFRHFFSLSASGGIQTLDFRIMSYVLRPCATTADLELKLGSVWSIEMSDTCKLGIYEFGFFELRYFIK